LKQIYGVTTYIIPDKRKQLKQIKPELMAFFYWSSFYRPCESCDFTRLYSL